MNFKSIGFKTSLAALAVTSTVLTFPANPAHALSLSFKPTGTSLDGDKIKDIKTTVNSVLNFDIYLETAGVADDDTVKTIQYNIDFDSNELKWVSFTKSALFSSLNLTPPSPSIGAKITQSGGTVAPDLAKLLVGTATFNVLKGLNNDGKGDFFLKFTSATDDDNEPFAGLTSLQAQSVEVQPVPTPALLPGLLALGAGIVRKRKAEATEEVKADA